MNDSKEIVRVACSNNFNCSEKEYAQLDEFAKQNPHRFFFVNSNIRTPHLPAINDHPYRAVITANPDLVVDQTLVKRLEGLDPVRVGFIRVKWLPGKPDIQGLTDELLEKRYPVVITTQRFNGKKKLLQYTELRHYQHLDSRYRLHGEALREVTQYVDQQHKKGLRAYLCDRKGLGCQGCGLCAMLTQGDKKNKLLSLNLSTSGICPYNCVDCYAKTMQNFLVKCGKIPIQFDVIKANKKQSGQTGHIKHAKEALKK